MSVTLRKIQDHDLTKIMNWRMDPDITRYMNTNPKLTLEGQKKWLASLENNNEVKNWMIEKNSKPVGLIYLTDIDWEKKTSSWGYYIGEKAERSLKLAVSLEMSLYDYVFDVMNFDKLHSEIFSLNSGVVKLHLLCGSYIIEEIKGEVEKEGVKYDVIHMSITKEDWHKIRLTKKYEKINYNINN